MPAVHQPRWVADRRIGRKSDFRKLIIVEKSLTRISIIALCDATHVSTTPAQLTGDLFHDRISKS
jgi:hypothetical protein